MRSKDIRAQQPGEQTAGTDEPQLSYLRPGTSRAFEELWQLAERYIRHGDGYFQRVGLKLIAQFADVMPTEDAATLLEWHFERCNYAPSPGYGAKPGIEEQAIAAAVAVGRTPRHPGAELQLRLRMLAVLSKSLLGTTDPARLAISERAMRALTKGDSRAPYLASVSQPRLLRGLAFDQELVEHCSDAVEDGRFDDAIRTAMIVLEDRIRTSTREGLDVVGADLAARVFDRNRPFNFGQTGAEKDGLLNLFRSVFLLCRNPVAHRFAQHDEPRALHVLAVVDLLLDLVTEANTRLYKPHQYLAPDEVGENVRVERVLLADVDHDGEDEHVLVYSYVSFSGPGTLGVLVLKQGNGKWHRLPVEGWRESRPLEELSTIDLMGDGRVWVTIRTRLTRSEARLYIFRWHGAALRPVRFIRRYDETKHETKHLNWAQRALTYDPAEGPPRFADVDGDGRLELYVQDRQIDTEGFPGGTEVRATGVFQFIELCEAFVLMDRRLIGAYSPKNEAAARIMSEEWPEARKLAEWAKSLDDDGRSSPSDTEGSPPGQAANG
ncbi:MAG: TIGR02391 family protein [Chloroflexi bacterium]|nr:TIGR02391 family protein [Chloroflexota bacterium]